MTCYLLEMKATLAPTTPAPAPAVATVVPAAPATAVPPSAAALAANSLGFECYKNRKSYEAIEHFTTAIDLDGTQHTYYLNRSGAFQKIKSWTCAIADARKVGIT